MKSEMQLKERHVAIIGPFLPCFEKAKNKVSLPRNEIKKEVKV